MNDILRYIAVEQKKLKVMLEYFGLDTVFDNLELSGTRHGMSWNIVFKAYRSDGKDISDPVINITFINGQTETYTQKYFDTGLCCLVDVFGYVKCFLIGKTLFAVCSACHGVFMPGSVCFCKSTIPGKYVDRSGTNYFDNFMRSAEALSEPTAL